MFGLNVLWRWAQNAGLIPGLRPANERRRYEVTPSLIGWRKPRISPEMCLSYMYLRLCIVDVWYHELIPEIFSRYIPQHMLKRMWSRHAISIVNHRTLSFPSRSPHETTRSHEHNLNPLEIVGETVTVVIRRQDATGNIFQLVSPPGTWHRKIAGLHSQ